VTQILGALTSVTAIIKADIAKWAKVIADASIKGGE
jgi:hypothetical protein